VTGARPPASSSSGLDAHRNAGADQIAIQFVPPPPVPELLTRIVSDFPRERIDPRFPCAQRTFGKIAYGYNTAIGSMSGLSL
jgi:hypothetical protein